MKKCKYNSEQERYYARKNREMDFFEANTRSFVYAAQAVDALMKEEKATLSGDFPDGLDVTTSLDSWDLDDATVSMEMLLGELKEIIQRAWKSGVNYGREQGGLESLFEGEV
ncbi:hypothetical protein DPU24_26285 [Salmonella enterica subsp. enterica serovar Oranienburg]|nr:hypothetical protein [Salmonella enterica subsp. enterica serovar Oranienburg]HAK8205168.1 hypothetical protein [Salmonella enterica]